MRKNSQTPILSSADIKFWSKKMKNWLKMVTTWKTNSKTWKTLIPNTSRKNRLKSWNWTTILPDLTKITSKLWKSRLVWNPKQLRLVPRNLLKCLSSLRFWWPLKTLPLFAFNESVLTELLSTPFQINNQITTMIWFCLPNLLSNNSVSSNITCLTMLRSSRVVKKKTNQFKITSISYLIAMTLFELIKF